MVGLGAVLAFAVLRRQASNSSEKAKPAAFILPPRQNPSLSWASFWTIQRLKSAGWTWEASCNGEETHCLPEAVPVREDQGTELNLHDQTFVARKSLDIWGPLYLSEGKVESLAKWATLVWL